jgi:nucleoside 2-deoxyribosyltransferase
MQAANIIRYMGDEISSTGRLLKTLPLALPAIAGSPNREFAARLAKELGSRGLIAATDASNLKGTELLNVGLTLDGWERYEAEKRGKFAGRYGFMALKFGDTVLDPLINDCIKPAVKTGIGYDVVDMRDVARAGIIDNLMREQIRDAAFVIVDLTHDNAGAYWEAGYAEGLGKPVIYICEREKFSEAQTHFDTNHCTTVIWSNDDRETFEMELIATLRRSLDLF